MVGGSGLPPWEAGCTAACPTRVRACACVLTQEAESLRLTAFEIYGALLAKVSRRLLVFPLRHQVLNLLVLLVLHLQDANVSVAQVRGRGAGAGGMLTGCERALGEGLKEAPISGLGGQHLEARGDPTLAPGFSAATSAQWKAVGVTLPSQQCPLWFPAPGITGLLSKPLSALCH